MEAQRFARLSRVLTSIPSRRDILIGLSGAGVALGLARRPEDAGAKKKRKNKKKTKKAKPNRFGCLEAGDPCKNVDQCCSGICEGKKGRRTCRARNVGTCTPDMPGFCLAPNPVLMSCNNRPGCACFRTTAGSNSCLDTSGTTDFCADCRKDTDCLALGFPAGSACIPVTAGNCSGNCESGMACFPPCAAVEPPESGAE